MTLRHSAAGSDVFEFYVAPAARQRYSFDETLFGLTGNVVFADFAAVRRFAQQMNAQRDLAADPEKPVGRAASMPWVSATRSSPSSSACTARSATRRLSRVRWRRSSSD